MYRQLTNRSAGVSVLVVIQLVEVQTIQEVIGHFSRRTAEPAAPRLGRYRLQDTDTDINSTHAYIHTYTMPHLRGFGRAHHGCWSGWVQSSGGSFGV